ncbi:MAG: MFS transporter [Dehalococcoidia bacterium]|nr:MFS transporter [Dehalococcoidia bacterium]
MDGRMPLGARLLYASGSLGGNALGRTRDLWLIFFYLGDEDGDPARRGGFWAITIVIFVGRLIEAFDDPLIGYWSDTTRSRWGRRIPFVLAATPFMAVIFILLWIPPNPGETIANVIWLFAIFWLFNLFSTLSGGPMESLLPEIARRADDRLGIVSWQVMFGVLGTVVAFVLSGPLIDLIGFTYMALIVAVVALISRYVALAGAWRRSVEASREIQAESPPERFSFRSALDSIRTSLRNDQFLVFLPSYVLYNGGVLMIVGVLPFYADAVLGRDDRTAVSLLTGSAIGVLLLVLPAVVYLARRFSKRQVYGWGMLFAAVYFPLFAIAGFLPGIPVLAQGIAYALLIGLPLAPVQTFPNALIADITDYDTIRTRLRREATFYATQATLEKIASAAASGLLLALLAIGSTADDPLGIRLVGPAAGILTIAGYIVFRRYWLPDNVTEESVAEARPS